MPRPKSPPKLKAVLDTSILVSAFLKPGGLSDELIRFAKSKVFALILSDEILEESRIALLEKNYIRQRYDYTNERVLEYIFGLEETCTKPTAIPTISVITQDPDDDKILACAIASPKADYIVTRDSHLLELKEYRGLKILKPEDFIKLLRGNR